MIEVSDAGNKGIINRGMDAPLTNGVNKMIKLQQTTEKQPYDDWNRMAIITLMEGLNLYHSCGNKFLLMRGYTITHMMKMVHQITGKKFPARQKYCKDAYMLVVETVYQDFPEDKERMIGKFKN